MRLHLLLLFTLLPATALAQSVTIAPLSMQVWGKTPSVSMASVEWKGIGVHYIYSSKETAIYNSEPVHMYDGPAVSYSRKIAGILQLGAIATPRPMPISSASHINAIVGLHYRFGVASVGYRHISNGFGLLNSTNPGMDHLFLTIHL